MFRNGTKFQSRGRWYTSNLVRWYEGAMQAIGGWQKLQDSSRVNLALTGPVRQIFAWRDNSANPRLAFATATKAYAFIQGVLTDITPGSLSAGAADSSITFGAFGVGAFGLGNFGGGDVTQSVLTDAASWQFDNFGQLLVAAALPDGRLFSWDLNTGNDLTAITNAPTGCTGVVVTPERFLMALGAGSDPRNVKWADQESMTTWTPDATNQAGDFPLSTNGRIMCGRRGKNETLIWTDADIWCARYIGGTLIYNFNRVGDQCGIISRNAMVMKDTEAYWMGQNGFYNYNGFTSSIPCEVSDYVFSDINRTQAAKIFATSRSNFREVYWHYPSASSLEPDRYVGYNTVEKFWMVGELQRTAGIDVNPFPYPIMGDALGAIYEHERGTAMLSPAGAQLTPSAESGPFEIDPNRTMTVLELVPDEKTAGGVRAYFYLGDYPNATETVVGPYTMTASKVDTRFSTRQARLKIEQVTPGWRWGVPKADVVPAGMR